MKDQLLFEGIWDDKLPLDTGPNLRWLWDGYLAESCLTLLTGMWKAGKTTLVSSLLRARVRGGFVAGREVMPGRTIVVSEESPAVWAERANKAAFGGKTMFLSRPWLSVPSVDEWEKLVDYLARACEQDQCDLVVIDPLAAFCHSEGHVNGILSFLMPLRLLQDLGVCVLALHHPSKTHTAIGQAARGSGALLGHVDINLEMRQSSNRRRRLVGFSRFEKTPRDVEIELSDDGLVYTLVDTSGNSEHERWLASVLMVLEAAPQKLTRGDILMEWPEGHARPSSVTLWRVLSRAIEDHTLCAEGAGFRSDPYRFWLPEREAFWKTDPLYDVLEKQRQELGLPYESLAQIKATREKAKFP